MEDAVCIDIKQGCHPVIKTLLAENDQYVPNDTCLSVSTFNNNCAASWENQQFGFRPGPTQTWLYSHRRWLEA